MNTARPSLARKHTRTTEQARSDQLEQGVRISLDGEHFYEVRAGDITGKHAARLRRESGYSFRRLLELLEEDGDIDVICTVVWLARIVKGDAVTLDEVLEDAGYEQMLSEGFTVEQVTDAEQIDGDNPEG